MTLVRTGNSGAVVYVQGVPGATGATGRPGVDAQAVPASTSVTALLAAQLDPANAGKVRSAQNLATRRFAGTFQDSGAAGSSPVVKHRGLNPLNLGAGLATAVGCKADGTPCRATDPLCVSAINFLGWCDEAGNFFDDPRMAERFNPRDFGAVGDNVTDDADAFEAMFARMSNGDACFIPTPPGGKYYLSRRLRPDRSVDIQGSGQETCVLRFGVGPCVEFRRASQTGAGDAQKSRLANVFLEGAKETYAEWAPLTAYAVGDKRRCKLGSLSSLNAAYQEDLGLHLECIAAGTSGATQPDWHDDPDGVTNDGSAVWKSVAHSGIVVSTGSVTIEKCTIYNVTDDGIFGYGTLPSTNADSLSVRDCLIISGDGNGIHVKGSDGNACLGSKNTVQGFTRGAIINDRAFLSNTWIANDGANCRRSYAGIGNASASLWLGNYWELDCADPKIKTPHIWIGAFGLDAHFAPETDCIRCNGNAFIGDLPVESHAADGTIVYQSIGLDDDAGLGSFQLGTDSRPNRTVWLPGDADEPGGKYRAQYNNSLDVREEITGERSPLGPGRKKYPRGVYLGSDISVSSRKATFVTSHAVPPGISPDTSGDCGRYLWRKGDVVHNCNAGSTGVTPGWIAARNGGWGAGRFHEGRVWNPSAPGGLWCIGEGVEPSTPNGKVYRVLRFEVKSGATWVTDDRMYSALGSVEPTWPTNDGDTVIETVNSTHRIVWECWGAVGMTWAVLPAPSTTVTT